MNDSNIVVLQTEPRLRHDSKLLIHHLQKNCTNAIKLYVENQTDYIVLIVDSLKYYLSEQQYEIQAVLNSAKPVIIVNLCKYQHEKDAVLTAKFKIKNTVSIVHVLQPELYNTIDKVCDDILKWMSKPTTEEIHITIDPELERFLQRRFDENKKEVLEMVDVAIAKAIKSTFAKMADKLQKVEDQPDTSVYIESMTEWCKSQGLNIVPIENADLAKTAQFIHKILPLLDKPPIEFMTEYSSYFLSSDSKFRAARLNAITLVYFKTLRGLINSTELWKFQGHKWYVGFATCLCDHGFRL